MDQSNIFEFLFDELPLWNKSLSVGELFSGYGSQAKALKNIGMKISDSYIIEIDIDATISYAAIHHNLNKVIKDYEFPTKEEMLKELEPLTLWKNDKDVNRSRLKLEKLQQVYLAIKLTKNYTNVFNVNGKDLPYADLITFSTPCQEFSLAGKRGGFDSLKGSLTFESVRVLKELKEHNKKPLFALFENVPGIVDSTNINGFRQFRKELRDLGYEDIMMELNAKDFGIPQNRKRIFLLLIDKEYLGDCRYDIPKSIPLEYKLKDMLQDNPDGKYNIDNNKATIEVDEKYYLSEKMKKYIINSNEKWTGNNNGAFVNKIIASTINTGEGSRRCDASNFILEDVNENNIELNDYLKIKEATKKGYSEAKAGDSVNLEQPKSKTRRGRVGKEVAQTLLTGGQQGVVVEDLRIRKLTELECWRLMGMDDEDYFNAANTGIASGQLYKQAGNSIYVGVLMAIFGNLLQRDWECSLISVPK